MSRGGYSAGAIVLIAVGLAINAGLVVLSFSVPIEPVSASTGTPTPTGIALLGIGGVGMLMTGLGVAYLVVRYVRR